MALDMLAQAYEAEDSQTMTFAKTFSKEDDSDGSDNEDTVVIQNDTYIERLIKANAHAYEPRYSESATLSLSPNAFAPYASSHKSMVKNHSTSPNFKGISLAYQPSQDFLLIVENFQKRLHEKINENEMLKNKLKEKTKDHERILTIDDDLKHQITKLKQKDNELSKSEVILKHELTEKNDEIDVLNNKISQQNIINESLCKQIEESETISEWLQMQIQLDSNKLSVKALEQWKNSIIIDSHKQQQQQQQQYDDEKEKEKNDENEEAHLLDRNLAIDNEEKKNPKKFKKKKYRKRERDTINVENQMENTNKPCCIPWFLVG